MIWACPFGTFSIWINKTTETRLLVFIMLVLNFEMSPGWMSLGCNRVRFWGWKAVVGLCRIDLLFIKLQTGETHNCLERSPGSLVVWGGSDRLGAPSEEWLGLSVTGSERQYTVINVALSGLALWLCGGRENMCGVELCLFVCCCLCVCMCESVGCLVIKADQTR